MAAERHYSEIHCYNTSGFILFLSWWKCCYKSCSFSFRIPLTILTISVTHPAGRCTRYPRSVGPSQNRRSYTLSCHPPGCWQISGRGGCSSSSRCTPCRRPPGIKQRDGFTINYVEHNHLSSSVRSPEPPCPPGSAVWVPDPRRLLGSPTDCLKKVKTASYSNKGPHFGAQYDEAATFWSLVENLELHLFYTTTGLLPVCG